MSFEERKELQSRPDLLIIADQIPEGSSVLDLGCGNGYLLRLLKKERDIYGCGVEISQDKILECVNTGVSVLHGDLNDGLTEFADNSFDFVVLSQTIQSVQRPDLLLEGMMRVGKKVIISFLNIGYITARMQLIFYGRMPVTPELPNSWYNTPNIHLATIRDFRNLCREKEIEIEDEIPFGGGFGFLARLWPNMFATASVFVIGSSSKAMTETSSDSGKP